MTRMDDMLVRYGECVKRTVAARILGKSSTTVNNMLKDGRIRANCGGEMVDVRSICEYIERPCEMDARARAVRTLKKNGSGWMV